LLTHYRIFSARELIAEKAPSAHPSEEKVRTPFDVGGFFTGDGQYAQPRGYAGGSV
jgi:hypothetical protein